MRICTYIPTFCPDFAKPLWHFVTIRNFGPISLCQWNFEIRISPEFVFVGLIELDLIIFFFCFVVSISNHFIFSQISVPIWCWWVITVAEKDAVWCDHIRVREVHCSRQQHWLQGTRWDIFWISCECGIIFSMEVSLVWCMMQQFRCKNGRRDRFEKLRSYLWGLKGCIVSSRPRPMGGFEAGGSSANSRLEC